jgi:hypothetical protein
MHGAGHREQQVSYEKQQEPTKTLKIIQNATGPNFSNFLRGSRRRESFAADEVLSLLSSQPTKGVRESAMRSLSRVQPQGQSS